MPKRSIIYIDGFNLYYGAVKDTPWKWLDIHKYFTLLRQDDQIIKIKYFTALIKGAHRQNQETFLQALGTFPNIEIIKGVYKQKRIVCKVKKCTYSGNKIFKSAEEKQTDVNIAINIYKDVIENACDRIVIVSGDSDLVPIIKLVKQIYPEKKIIVYIPTNHPARGAAVEIRSSADKHKTLPNLLLKKCQLPSIVYDSNGTSIRKPSMW
ncbi:MAG: NYN domain-containing protein [Bacteroidetes bacterium]|nr:NYN domain-containing protein [Bacteroidota bacterium]MBU2584704.1 NYN domain-containing protein [Bacteroidota bacterium]